MEQTFYRQEQLPTLQQSAFSINSGYYQAQGYLSGQLQQQQSTNIIDNACGQSHSGSSAFSSGPCLDSAILNDLSGHPFLEQQLGSMQQQQQQQGYLSSLSRHHSCHSNEISGTVSQLQQQHSNPQPPETLLQQQAAGPSGWAAIVQHPGLTQAASRICAGDDDTVQETTHQQHYQQQQQQQAGSHTGSPEMSLLDAAASGDHHVVITGMMTTTPSSPHGSGVSAALPASPTVAADESLGQVGEASGEAVIGAKPSLPTAYLKVSCGDMIGTLLVHKAKIVINEGTRDEKEVSPTEFERLGGRSATKKWKQSIRLIAEDGELGRPVGEWYVMQGLEQPKKPRETKELSSPHPALAGNTAAATAGSSSPERHGSSSGGGRSAAAAAAAAGSNKRPIRATRHAAAAAAADADAAVASVHHHPAKSTRRGSRKSQPPPNYEDAGSGTTGSPADVTAAAAAAGDQGVHDAAGAAMPSSSWMGHAESLSMQHSLPDPVLRGNMAAAAAAAAGTEDDDAAAAALDAAAVGDYQMPSGAAAFAASLPVAGAAAAAGGPVLLPVPVAEELPGDASQAVIEMTAYLEGRRATPPWRLLPLHQRPLVGRQLVPLRPLFVLVMQAGGYKAMDQDLLKWQSLAEQLGLPGWPSPEIPDPLRVLQQVYKDYLLRFEMRFRFQEPGPGAAAAALHQSPTLSTATQFAGSQQQQQQQQQQGPAPSGLNSSLCSAVTTAAGVQQIGDCALMPMPSVHNFIDSSMVGPQARVQQQQQQQQHSLQLNMPMHGQLAAPEAQVRDEPFSSDLLDFLADFLPDEEDAVMPGPEHQPSLPSSSATAPGPAAPTGQFTGRQQHTARASLQQRQRLQQLQQQIHQQQQVLQQHQGPSPNGPRPAASGSRGGSASVAAAAAAAGCSIGGSAARLKRPAPLIRCGDSDVVNLLDQSEVTKLLQDYEQQQQQHQQHLTALRQQRQGLLPPQMPTPSSSQLAAAVTGAVDRNMSKDLQAIMQGYWQQQGSSQPRQQLPQSQPPPEPQQQEPQQEQYEAQAADEEMSGMLEALQLAGDALPNPSDLPGSRSPALNAGTSAFPVSTDHLVIPANSSSAAAAAQARDEGWGAGTLMPTPDGHLYGQGSVGAHLFNLGAATTAAGDGSSSNNISNNNNGMMAAPAPRNMGSAAAARGPSPLRQQQPQPDDAGYQGFQDGLMRLTTPNSVLIGSVLESPTNANPGHGWMDISGRMDISGQVGGLTSADLRSMTIELAGAADEAGPSADDLAAVLQLW